MALEFKKNDEFEDLGSLKEYFSGYGECKISIDNFNDSNIILNIKSSQEIQFNLLCSYALSNIIKKQKTLPEKLESYRILRIKKYNGEKYIRVSQNIVIDGNQTSFEEYQKISNKVEGNVSLGFTISESKTNSIKPFNPEDLVAF